MSINLIMPIHMYYSVHIIIVILLGLSPLSVVITTFAYTITDRLSNEWLHTTYIIVIRVHTLIQYFEAV